MEKQLILFGLNSILQKTKGEYFLRGLSYYNSGLVNDIAIHDNGERVIINSLVEGSEIYSSYIYLERTKTGVITDYHCDCPFYSKNEQICKHIIASAIYVVNRFDEIRFYKEDNSEEINYLLNLLIDNTNEIEKQKINIEYTLEFVNSRYTSFAAQLSLKIGIDKLYIVKNLSNFLDALENDYALEFGKNFIFNPHLQEFKEEDRPIIEYLLHMHSADSVERPGGYNYRNYNDLFSGKFMYLTNRMLKSLLQYFKNKPFNVIFNNYNYYNVFAEFDESPFKLILDEKDDNIVVELKNTDNSIVLTYNKDFIFLKNKVYVLDEKSLEYKAFSVLNSLGRASFSGEDKAKLLSIIPRISRNKTFEIDEKLNSKFIVEKLHAKVYIDKYKKGIKLNVNFEYGDKKINPFSEKEKDEFLVRNYDEERKILNIIMQSGFTKKDDYVYVEEDSKLYMFFKNSLPILKELADIFYTDAVKGIYREKSLNVRTSVKSNNFGLIDLNFEIDDIDKKEIAGILKSIKEKKNYHRLKNGEIISLEGENTKDVLKFLDDIEEKEIKDGKIELETYRAISLFNKIDDTINIENRHIVDDLINNIKKSKEEKIEIPFGLQKVLRDYQVTGYKWLKTLANLELGGILADDMGLGKTLQAITLLSSESVNGKSIIIAPSSLVYNWQKEFEKFAPDIKTLVVQGDKKKREELIGEVEKYDVIITSYPLLRRDIEFYKNYYFNICILDEAQHIKNPDSLNSISVKKIKSRVRFALTGTPMENNLLELWSIFDFILPGLLYSKHRFMEKYDRPITKDEDKYILDDLKKTISPFILRRKKTDVLTELPEKIETKLICEMTKIQREIYNTYLIRAKEDVNRMISEGEFETSKIQVLKLLTRLRQICCHPSMFLEEYHGDSGKLEQLKELLEELIEGNHKVLIFSQFTTLLDIVKKMLNKNKIKFLYLDGSTDVSKRQLIVDEFNEGNTNVFLLSLKAGGTGLNLTTADTVIHLDPWWNPAVEEQASDRAHRIGQKNVVQVFKLITKDTIEEKIYELQNKKKELIDSVIQEGEVFISSLSEKEILEILG